MNFAPSGGLTLSRLGDVFCVAGSAMSAPRRPIEGGGVSTFVTRPFRFGVVCPLTTDLHAWRDRVRRIADSGYSTLLTPDVPGWQPAPGPTLALAAELADIRVGTWVYASPVRPA